MLPAFNVCINITISSNLRKDTLYPFQDSLKYVIFGQSITLQNVGKHSSVTQTPLYLMREYKYSGTRKVWSRAVSAKHLGHSYRDKLTLTILNWKGIGKNSRVAVVFLTLARNSQALFSTCLRSSKTQLQLFHSPKLIQMSIWITVLYTCSSVTLTKFLIRLFLCSSMCGRCLE